MQHLLQPRQPRIVITTVLPLMVHLRGEVEQQRQSADLLELAEKIQIQRMVEFEVGNVFADAFYALFAQEVEHRPEIGGSIVGQHARVDSGKRNQSFGILPRHGKHFLRRHDHVTQFGTDRGKHDRLVDPMNIHGGDQLFGSGVAAAVGTEKAPLDAGVSVDVNKHFLPRFYFIRFNRLQLP
ncbi:hypothetical protein SDC9_150762 [bioreactor metagenome]|uniref:Uncharacterized protein n=1 Tax=bioreactor metagenome TaxID=1076179 RepID=A0A645EQI7_9ZZZZ